MTNEPSKIVDIQGNIIRLERVQRISRPIGTVYNNQIRYKFDIVYDDCSVVEIESDYTIRFFEDNEIEHGDIKNTDIKFSLAKVENGLLVDIFEELPNVKAYEELKVVIFESIKAMHEKLVSILTSPSALPINDDVCFIVEEDDSSIVSTIDSIKLLDESASDSPELK